MPVRSELLAQLGELQHRAQHCLSRRVERSRERFELTVCRWPEPQAIFAPMVQRLDEVGERLPRSLSARAGSARADLNLVAGRLRRDSSTSASRGSASGWAPRGKWPSWPIPSRPLSQGFARVTGRDGKTLTRARDAREAQRADAAFRRRGRRCVDRRRGHRPGRLSASRRKPYIAAASRACSIRQRIRRMLMHGSGRAARIHYLPGTFRLLSDGDHVVCAVTGAESRSTNSNIGASSGRSPMSTPRPA